MDFCLHLTLLPVKLIGQHLELLLLIVLSSQPISQGKVILSKFEQFRLQSLNSLLEFVSLEFKIGILLIKLPGLIISSLDLPLHLINFEIELPPNFVDLLIVADLDEFDLIVLLFLELRQRLPLETHLLHVLVLVDVLLIPQFLRLRGQLPVLPLQLLYLQLQVLVFLQQGEVAAGTLRVVAHLGRLRTRIGEYLGSLSGSVISVLHSQRIQSIADHPHSKRQHDGQQFGGILCLILLKLMSAIKSSIVGEEEAINQDLAAFVETYVKTLILHTPHPNNPLFPSLQSHDANDAIFAHLNDIALDDNQLGQELREEEAHRKVRKSELFEEISMETKVPDYAQEIQLPARNLMSTINNLRIEEEPKSVMPELEERQQFCWG